jgi:hypothetical protein
MTSKRIKTIVVCLNFQHFKIWCQENDKNPRNRNLVSITTGSDADAYHKLRGRLLEEYDEIIYYGPWYEGRYAQKIEQMITALMKRRSDG